MVVVECVGSGGGRVGGGVIRANQDNTRSSPVFVLVPRKTPPDTNWAMT